MLREDEIAMLKELHAVCSNRVISAGAVSEKEDEFARWANTEFCHRNLLVEVSLDLIAEAIYEAPLAFADDRDQSRVNLFIQLVAWYSGNLQKLRAAEALFYRGYGMIAIALLRDIREWTYQVAALQCEVISWEKFHGPHMGVFKLEDDGDERTRKNDVLDCQHRARRWAIGQTGNKPRYALLRDWDRYPNVETHGSLLSTTFQLEAWRSRRHGNLLGPEPVEQEQRLYVYWMFEVCHLFVRVLPILQANKRLSTEWAERWKIIDGIYLRHWSVLPPRAPYLSAFVEMIADAFNFDPVATRLGIVPAPGDPPALID